METHKSQKPHRNPQELYPLLNEKLWTPETRNKIFKILADEQWWRNLPEAERNKMASIVKDRVPRFTKKQRPRINLMTQKFPPPEAVRGEKQSLLSDNEMYPLHNELSHPLPPLHSDLHWDHQSPYDRWALDEPFGLHYRGAPMDRRVLEKENYPFTNRIDPWDLDCKYEECKRPGESIFLDRLNYKSDVCHFKRHGQYEPGHDIPFSSLQYDDRNNSPPVYQSTGFWRSRDPVRRPYSDGPGAVKNVSQRGEQRSDTAMTINSDEDDDNKGDPTFSPDSKKMKRKNKKRKHRRPSNKQFDINAHMDRIYNYLLGESEPVPIAQMESMFPLPNSCKERSLLKLLTRTDRFRSLTVHGNKTITLERSSKHHSVGDSPETAEPRSDEPAQEVPEFKPKQSSSSVHWLSNSCFDAERWQRGCPLFDHKARQTDMVFLPECARIGMLQPSMSEKGDCIYLNIHEPFCGVMVGVQGAGKSHTTNCIIENCMISNPPITKIKQPLSTLVFHYDQNEDIACEAASLTTIGSPDPDLEANPNSVLGNLVVLVSPGNFKKRYHKYRELPNCKVYPLLLGFSRLGVVQLKQLMNVGKDEHQLYMQVVMAVLRRRQKAGWPAQTFEEFKEACLEQKFLKQQSNPLRQRLQLLESFLYDTEENESFRMGAAQDLTHYFQPGTMVICDLTDPLIDPQGANCMFQVILSLFIEKRMKCGKLVVFDEAHKYLDRSVGNLCDDVTHLVRQMRHYGVRVLVSTQNPMVLPHELLELCSFAILHRFFSRVWFDHLRSRLNLSPETLQECCNLRTGEAVVYCSQGKILQPAPISVIGPKTYRCLIRERMTRDNGITIVNEFHGQPGSS